MSDFIKALGLAVITAVASLLTLFLSNRNAQRLARQSTDAQREMNEATLAHQREMEILRLNHEASERRFEVRRAAINEFTAVAASIMHDAVPSEERNKAVHQLIGLYTTASTLLDREATLAASNLCNVLRDAPTAEAAQYPQPANRAMFEWMVQARRALASSPLTASGATDKPSAGATTPCVP